MSGPQKLHRANKGQHILGRFAVDEEEALHVIAAEKARVSRERARQTKPQRTVKMPTFKNLPGEEE